MNQRTAEDLAKSILANLKAPPAFTVEEGGTKFHIFHTDCLDPAEPITIAVVVSENTNNPLVIAALLEGWAEEAEVKTEITRGRASLS